VVGAADWPLSLLPTPFPMCEVVDFYAAQWPNFTSALSSLPRRHPPAPTSTMCWTAAGSRA
jgi:hypothetical protein